MDLSRRGFAVVVSAVMLMAALLGSQAMAESLAPAPAAGQAATIGRAGFAYVASLRRFAAAVLWNRLEPQFHEYYGDEKLRDMTFLLPNTRLVTALDPQLVEAYFVAPYVLLERGKDAEAIALAADGVSNNPDSGRLHAAYAQVLQLSGRLEAAVSAADAARETGTWRSPAEEIEGLAMLKGVYQAAGLTEKAASVIAEIQRANAEYEAAKAAGGTGGGSLGDDDD